MACTRVVQARHASSCKLPPSLCCSACNCGGYRNSNLIETHPGVTVESKRTLGRDAKPKRQGRAGNEHAAHGTSHEVRYSSVSMKVSLQQVQELAWAVVTCLGGGLACSCSLRDHKPLPIYPITIPPPQSSPCVRPWPLEAPRVLSTPLLASSHVPAQPGGLTNTCAHGAVAPLACTLQTVRCKIALQSRSWRAIRPDPAT